jgi:hypothetical protein
MQPSPGWTITPRSAEQQQNHHHNLPSSAVTNSYIADASSRAAGSDPRHTPPGGNLTTTSPPGQTFTSPWHSLPIDQRAVMPKQNNAGPLTLQIPDAPGE